MSLPILPGRAVPEAFFSPTHTWSYLILWLAVALFVWLPYASQAPEDKLNYPAEMLILTVEKNLAFYDAVEASSPAWKTLHRFLWGSRDEYRQTLPAAFRGVVQWQLRHPEWAGSEDIFGIKLRQILLLAENGDWLAADDELMRLEGGDGRVVDCVRFAYGGNNGSRKAPSLDSCLELLEPGWFQSQLGARFSERSGDTQAWLPHKRLAAQTAQQEFEDTSRYVVLSAIPFVLGILIFVYMLRRFAWRDVLQPQLQPPWSFREGAAVFVRGEFWGNALYVGFDYFLLGGVLVFLLLFANSWSALFAALPMLWLMQHYLLAPRGLNFITAFGLSPRQFGWGRLFGWTMVLITIDSLGSMLIYWLSDLAGFEVPWNEGISETMVWGNWWQTGNEIINTVIWAPLAEEIVFRGMLYLTLRNIMRPLYAAVLTALLFSLLHFYSFPAFLTLLWGGIIWSLAFERCRSLLPSMAAHSLGNIDWVVAMIVFYR